jgi:hypothetical protein
MRLEKAVGQRRGPMTFHQLLVRRVIALALATVVAAGICWGLSIGWLLFFTSIATIVGMIVVDVAKYGLAAFRTNPIVRPRVRPQPGRLTAPNKP